MLSWLTVYAHFRQYHHRRTGNECDIRATTTRSNSLIRAFTANAT
ncbi:hypothetical protein ACNKHK_24440 [Shigella flexneri]